MLLACNYSEQLIELLNNGSINIDYIKLGNLTIYDGIYGKALSLRPVMLHGLGLNEDSSMKNINNIDVYN